MGYVELTRFRCVLDMEDEYYIVYNDDNGWGYLELEYYPVKAPVFYQFKSNLEAYTEDYWTLGVF